MTESKPRRKYRLKRAEQGWILRIENNKRCLGDLAFS